ncbi:MAG: hypothetical protein ABFD50_08880 [Smithella sp.]
MSGVKAFDVSVGNSNVIKFYISDKFIISFHLIKKADTPTKKSLVGNIKIPECDKQATTTCIGVCTLYAETGKAVPKIAVSPI